MSTTRPLILDGETLREVTDAELAELVGRLQDKAMLFPEGDNSQRPLVADIPAGKAAVRGNTQTVGDYFLELWNHVTETWDALASRVWVVAKINGALQALDDYLPKSIGQLAGMRNKIINGKMEIAQRGTSFPSIANGAYSLDRWCNVNISSAVVTISQQSNIPINEFQNCLRVAVTTADTSISAGDTFGIEHRIEGFNVRDLIGRALTLSFWVRSSKTGIHCASFRNVALDRSFIAEYTINAANTWEYKTITLPGGLITSGGWDWESGIGLNVRFALAAGANFQATKGAWQTGNFHTTANQVNCLDAVGNTFDITGVQLEAGEVATPFEHRPYGVERAMCQRYTFITLANSIYARHYAGVASASCNLSLYFPVTMRATPTVTTPPTWTGANIAATPLQTGSPSAIHYALQATAAGDCYAVNSNIPVFSAEL